MPQLLKLEKLTNNKWLNLFSLLFKNKKGKEIKWEFFSRKKDPFTSYESADAVVIVPIVKSEYGNKILVIKEFRAPIWGYEWGFPAGLIDDSESIQDTVKRELKEETGLEVIKINEISPFLYSSAGATDESVVMVFVEAQGDINYSQQEDTEDIEVFLMNIDEVKELLNSNKKIGAKAWGILWHYIKIGEIK